MTAAREKFSDEKVRAKAANDWLDGEEDKGARFTENERADLFRAAFCDGVEAAQAGLAKDAELTKRVRGAAERERAEREAKIQARKPPEPNDPVKPNEHKPKA